MTPGHEARVFVSELTPGMRRSFALFKTVTEGKDG